LENELIKQPLSNLIGWAVVKGFREQKQKIKQGTSFFFKQWGTWGADGIKRNKKLNGKFFKGKIWHEYPNLVNT